MARNTPSTIEPLHEQLVSAYPSVAHLPDGEAALSALTGASVADVLAALEDPETAERAEKARLRAEAEGKTIAPLARHTAIKLINRILRQADSVDAFEAAELMRPINRILENADRVRIAEQQKDSMASLPVFNFVFNSGGLTVVPIKSEPLPVVEVDLNSGISAEGGD